MKNLIHELQTTEFQLNLWQTCQQDHLQLLTAERRYFTAANQLTYTHRGRQRTVIPDLGCVVRVTTSPTQHGFLCLFCEIDRSTESIGKLTKKYRAYAHWAASTEGTSYLLDLFRSLGAKNPKPTFRLLMVATAADDSRRLLQLLLPSLDLPRDMLNRIWLTTATALQTPDKQPVCLTEPLWIRAADCVPWLPEYQRLSHKSPNKLKALRRRFVADRINDLPRHRLFPPA